MQVPDTVQVPITNSQEPFSLISTSICHEDVMRLTYAMTIYVRQSLGSFTIAYTAACTITEVAQRKARGHQCTIANRAYRMVNFKL
ncbi:uncharacterized protein PHALS_03042 [Plasmopara halstedii]|uniref:Uncharacterized protein n=1 Tax=Plasmopara halstedii TaxID=4781 RepID=A0A0P1A836_PLAHL|nr:uncharacterized protein PHALS_03042 [Plasmopara halstedii]CEG36494.1 hypothetical protein PHALS_03042 [Plasmopara halstedii]|eukprot:XP_024572863.1 hypothetical protein PHALS_03042 [Plasmopara halstedii]